jgi:hypothetical protein
MFFRARYLCKFAPQAGRLWNAISTRFQQHLFDTCQTFLAQSSHLHNERMPDGTPLHKVIISDLQASVFYLPENIGRYFMGETEATVSEVTVNLIMPGSGMTDGIHHAWKPGLRGFFGLIILFYNETAL